MKRIALIIAALTLAGCATGPTKAERCAGYRITLVSAENLPASPDREARIAFYKALVEECKREGL